MGIENLDRIFKPERIAVIGASDQPGSIGARIFRNLRGNYSGTVFPINPFRAKVQEVPTYRNITEVPVKVDLAIIATPAATVPKLIEECGKAGVLGAIIISAGFNESIKESETLQKQLLECKKAFNIRIIGPNSFGVIRPKSNFYATFGDKVVKPGKIAFISQSAALCAWAIDWAAATQVGLSAVVSTGAMLDVSLADLIDYFGNDSQTRSIVLYVESVKNARSFMSAARGFAKTKPIVVLKAGRFKESSSLTLTHSGFLAGEDAVYDAAFKRVGIVRVEGISELFNCAEALAMQPRPSGSKLMVITNAGGPGIVAADRLFAKGGRLAHLSNESTEALRRALPSYCSVVNPIDILEEAPPERFRDAIKICLSDPDADGILIIHTPQGSTESVETARLIAETTAHAKKTILTSMIGEDENCHEARRLLRGEGIPTFNTPEEAVSVFMHMYSYTRNLELLYQTPEELIAELPDQNALKGILRRAFCEGRQILSLPESMLFLEAYRIPVARTIVAKTPEEASRASLELGFPTVLKALSHQLTHKSEIEGVALNVCSPEGACDVFKKLEKRVLSSQGPAEFLGVAVQPMIRNTEVELLLGSKRDAQFGSTVIFGAGGISAELFKDTSVGFPPLNQILARRLMEDTKIYEHASRRKNSLHFERIEEILVKFSQLVIDFPEIREIDVNPLIVNEDGVIAVDARMVIDRERIMREVAEHPDHLVVAPYPKKFRAMRELKNKTMVMLRPIRPEDEERFNELFKSLSEETKRLRFFEIIKELSHDTLTRYCNLDYYREMAIVAEIQDGGRRIIGAARLIVEPNGKDGEFAILVGDAWQNLNLGSKLMDQIIDVAKDMHLEKIHGYTVPDNYRMVRLSIKKGFETQTLDEYTVKMSLKMPC